MKIFYYALYKCSIKLAKYVILWQEMFYKHNKLYIYGCFAPIIEKMTNNDIIILVTYNCILMMSR